MKLVEWKMEGTKNTNEGNKVKSKKKEINIRVMKKEKEEGKQLIERINKIFRINKNMKN